MPISTTDFQKFPQKNLNVSGNLALVKNTPETSPFRRLLSQWLDTGRADGLSPRTLQDYQDKLGKFLWWWEEYTGYAEEYGQHPRFLTTPLAREFAAYLREKIPDRWGITGRRNNRDTSELSYASIAAYGRSVKAFFNWLEREEYIPKSPFTKSVKFANRQKPDKVIKSISPEELTRIFRVLTEPERIASYTGLRNLAIVAMLVDSGIRRGELLSLRLSDIELGQGRCIVRGKTGQRVALFGDLCRTALVNYLQHPYNEKLEADSPLWLSENGEALGYAGFGMMIKRLEKASGVDFHAHSLRHTFATMMAQQGTNVFDLKEMLGHASITTTQIYVQQNMERLSEVHRLKSPLSVLSNQEKVDIKRRGRPRKYR